MTEIDLSVIVSLGAEEKQPHLRMVEQMCILLTKKAHQAPFTVIRDK